MYTGIIKTLDDLTDFKPLTRQEIEDHKQEFNNISRCVVFGRDSVYYIKALKGDHLKPVKKLCEKVEIRFKYTDHINDKIIIINDLYTDNKTKINNGSMV